MKKFFSFLMAMGVAATLSAQSTSHAPKAALTDTIKVACASWETTQESGTQYTHVLKDNATEPAYEFQFNCMAYGVESMVGTFIVVDPDDFDAPDDYIDESDSHVTVYSDGMGDESAVVYGTKLVVKQTAAGYELTATVVDESGAVYAVTAHRDAKPEAKKTVELNYTVDADFWATKSLFGFTAKDKFADVSADSIDTHIVIKGDPKTVVGEYAVADFADGNYIAYEGTETKRVTFWDEISATITADDDYYTCHVELFGSDTILYKITLKAEKPEVIVPKSTVKIKATNLSTTYDESAGLVDFSATNEDGDEVSLLLKTSSLYGSYTLENVKMGSITHNGSRHSVSLALEVDLTVAEDDNYMPYISGSVLGNDTVLYVLELNHALPEPKDQIDIEFTTAGESCFYSRQGYYFMFNANKEYLMAMEVYTSMPEDDEYTYFDFNRSYTHLGVINGTDTTDVTMLNCVAAIEEKSEKEYALEAYFLGSDSILYHITSTFNYTESQAIEYDAVTGSVDRTYTAADRVAVRVEDEENQKVYFGATSQAQSDMVALFFYVEDTTQVLIPAGTYDIDDCGAAGTVYACQGIDPDDGKLYPSYYGTLNEKNHLSSVYMIVSGTVKVEYVEGKLTLTLDGKNSNELPVKIVYDGTKTALDTTTTRPSAIKFVQDGTVYIRLNGHTYTMSGAAVE